jgi:ABC-type antimicrobial peptide transport system permease subunit
MAYTTARRTNEIGIRMALGARPERIAWMVLRETLLLAVAAILLAVPAAVAFGPAFDHALAPGWRDSFVYGMKAIDTATIALAVLALAIVGLLAGYLPARRAARMDPATVLRHD